MRIPQRGCGSPGLKVTPLWGWGKHPVGPGCGWRKERSSGSICYQISGQERDVNSWYKWKKPHIQIPWCSWGTSAFISAGSAHRHNNPGGLWTAFLLMKADTLLDLTLSNQEKLQGKVKAGSSWCCTHHEVMKFRITRRNMAKKGIKPWNLGEQILAYSETCLEVPHLDSFLENQ